MHKKILVLFSLLLASSCSHIVRAPSKRNPASVIDLFQYRSFRQHQNHEIEIWSFPDHLVPKKTKVKPLYKKHQFSSTYYDCTVLLSDNDDKQEACKDYKGPYTSFFGKVGTRNVFHTLENISNFLTPELESSYQTILMVNTARQGSSSNGFIPPQHLLMLKKDQHSQKFFKRNKYGTIIGIEKNIHNIDKTLSSKRKNIARYTKKNAGAIKTINGLRLLPISSGKTGNNGIYTFSGIFQVNEGKSRNKNNNLRKNWKSEAPMTNALYIGYFYNNSKGERGRSSGIAIHGTPSYNWGLLGKRRASHGCVRAHPYLAKLIYDQYMTQGKITVPELDWDYEKAVSDNETPFYRRRPTLIIFFNGYAGKSA